MADEGQGLSILTNFCNMNSKQSLKPSRFPCFLGCPVLLPYTRPGKFTQVKFPLHLPLELSILLPHPIL